MSSRFPARFRRSWRSRANGDTWARVNLFIKDKFSFALSADLAFKYGLRPKMMIDAAFLQELLREDGEAKTLTTALNFIGYRPRAEEEIRARLQRDEWSETVAVIAKLRDNKFWDDAQFASDWVESRSRSKSRGARLLKQELRHKGVAKEEIDAAMPDADEEIENAVVALAKLERKLAKWEKGRDRTQKAIEMMARRGFGYGTVKTALRTSPNRAAQCDGGGANAPFQFPNFRGTLSMGRGKVNRVGVSIKFL